MIAGTFVTKDLFRTIDIHSIIKARAYLEVTKAHMVNFKDLLRKVAVSLVTELLTMYCTSINKNYTYITVYPSKGKNVEKNCSYCTCFNLNNSNKHIMLCTDKDPQFYLCYRRVENKTKTRKNNKRDNENNIDKNSKIRKNSGTAEQVDPLIVASYMYILAKEGFGKFLEEVNWNTVCVCKPGELAGLKNFVKVTESEHTFENPVDCPDVSKYTYGILLYYLSHLKIKKDLNIDLAGYKTKTMERVKEILRYIIYKEISSIYNNMFSLSLKKACKCTIDSNYDYNQPKGKMVNAIQEINVTISDIQEFSRKFNLPAKVLKSDIDSIALIARKCGFNNVEEKIKDQFIASCKHSKLQERRTEKNRQKLQEVIDFSRQFEIFNKPAKKLSQCIQCGQLYNNYHCFCIQTVQCAVHMQIRPATETETIVLTTDTHAPGLVKDATIRQKKIVKIEYKEIENCSVLRRLITKKLKLGNLPAVGDHVGLSDILDIKYGEKNIDKAAEDLNEEVEIIERDVRICLFPILGIRFSKPDFYTPISLKLSLHASKGLFSPHDIGFLKFHVKKEPQREFLHRIAFDTEVNGKSRKIYETYQGDDRGTIQGSMRLATIATIYYEDASLSLIKKFMIEEYGFIFMVSYSSMDQRIR
ncbi:hypothetical protein A3Q56_04157 [Intoshia linei]|uniref:Uncharacterized protein n=1 Tax=Intoshia linei TaxID=1819745 RepID=A0A177B3A7_9BILA|nr:hypothetical protein A3Q56_04157 [Intoshia linei]